MKCLHPSQLSFLSKAFSPGRLNFKNLYLKISASKLGTLAQASPKILDQGNVSFWNMPLLKHSTFWRGNQPRSDLSRQLCQLDSALASNVSLQLAEKASRLLLLLFLHRIHLLQLACLFFQNPLSVRTRRKFTCFPTGHHLQQEKQMGYLSWIDLVSFFKMWYYLPSWLFEALQLTLMEAKWPRKECAKTANEGGGGGGLSYSSLSFGIFLQRKHNPSQSLFPYFLSAKFWERAQHSLAPSSPLTRQQAWSDLQNQIQFLYKTTMFMFVNFTSDRLPLNLEDLCCC